MRVHVLLAVCLLGCQDDGPTDQVSKTGSRLQVLSYEMADGSRLVRGFWDGQTQEDCDVRMHADGKLRCIPSLAYTLGPYFRSEQCFGELVAVVPKEFAPHSKFALESDGFRVRVFGVGATSGAVYDGKPEACTRVDVGDNRTAYTVSGEVSGGDFVEAFEQRNP